MIYIVRLCLKRENKDQSTNSKPYKVIIPVAKLETHLTQQKNDYHKDYLSQKFQKTKTKAK